MQQRKSLIMLDNYFKNKYKEYIEVMNNNILNTNILLHILF